MIPAFMFGVELVVNVLFFEKLLYGMQARWMRGMLGTRATIPRIVMMLELGVGECFLHCMGESHDATCSLAGGSQI